MSVQGLLLKILILEVTDILWTQWYHHSLGSGTPPHVVQIKLNYREEKTPYTVSLDCIDVQVLNP